MLVFTALIFIGVLVTGLLSMEVARTYYYKSVEDKLLTSAKLIESRVSTGLSSGSVDFEALCKQFGNTIEERVTIVSSDGTVLGDSDADVSSMENHLTRPEITLALEEGFGKNIGVSGTLDTETLYIAIPFKKDTIPSGAIRVAMSLKEIKAIQKKIWYYIFLAISLGVLTALVLGYRYLSTFTRPIGEMTVMASQIAGGKYDRRVRVRGTDEIGMLASTFNHMAERMEHTVEELTKDKSKIEAILSSSVNGVIAVDMGGNVMFLNPNAERMLDIRDDEPIGKSLFELISNEDAEKILHNALEIYETQTFEFELVWPKKRVIRVIGAPIKPKIRHGRTIGILLTFQDITTVHKLQKIRSDFVSNVTHELKTPLTSIKGFVETLRDGAIEDREKRDRFLEIIDIETTRLKRLIEDILLLSEIESSSPYLLSAEEINVQGIINEEVISMFAQKAEDKKVDIEAQFAANLPTLLMNRDRFKQMLINLVDNAIKFTEGGGKVQILVHAVNQSMVFKIKDNGIGIPREHRDRLFERFYRVDKGRSRKEGGTGLGLAIVKHIVLSLEGSVEIKSQPGYGTEVVITLPL